MQQLQSCYELRPKLKRGNCNLKSLAKVEVDIVLDFEDPRPVVREDALHNPDVDRVEVNGEELLRHLVPLELD